MKWMILATVLSVSTSGTVAAQELRFLNAFDSRYPPTEIIVEHYADAIEKATDGQVTFRHSGPEVVNAFQQFDPVSKGAFDMLFTVQPYHVGTTSVSLGIYTLKPDPEAFRESGIFHYLDEEYQRFNLKLLAIIPGSDKDTGAFHALLSEPIGPSGDIQGRRVRGNPFYQPLIDKLGGSMIVLQVGEVYSALQRGTIDGAFGPISGTMDYKWHEVAKYSLRPNFGHIYQFLLINTSSFDKLSPDVQKLMIDEAEKLEVYGMRAMTEALLKEDEELRKSGMILTRLSPDKYQVAIQALSDGIWKTAEGSRATGDRAKAFHSFITETKLPGIASR